MADRTRLAVYLDPDVKDWLEERTLEMRCAPSTWVAQLISYMALNGVAPGAVMGSITGAQGSCTALPRVVHGSAAPAASEETNGPPTALPRVAGSPSQPSTSALKKEKKKTQSDVEPEGFDEFWSNVPRRVGKGQARKAYRAALKKATPEALRAAVLNWKASCIGQDPKFVPHPSTWLNGERWEDEAAPAHDERYDPDCWTHEARLQFEEEDRQAALRRGEG